jgi:hypothetical protein
VLFGGVQCRLILLMLCLSIDTNGDCIVQLFNPNKSNVNPDRLAEFLNRQLTGSFDEVNRNLNSFSSTLLTTVYFYFFAGSCSRNWSCYYCSSEGCQNCVGARRRKIGIEWHHFNIWIDLSVLGSKERTRRPCWSNRAHAEILPMVVLTWHACSVQSRNLRRYC